jgi:hypothetical protein
MLNEHKSGPTDSTTDSVAQSAAVHGLQLLVALISFLVDLTLLTGKLATDLLTAARGMAGALGWKHRPARETIDTTGSEVK